MTHPSLLKLLPIAAAGLIGAAATADMVGTLAFGSFISAAEFGGSTVHVYVEDLYVVSNDSDDTLLEVFNLTLGSSAASDYFQSFIGTGWLPSNPGDPFDTEALQIADSFVTIGGVGPDVRQTPGAGVSTVLDPNFGGNTVAAPGPLAGWYDGSPADLSGRVMEYDNGLMGVFIGRFVSQSSDTTIWGSSFDVTWNQGPGTEIRQTSLMLIPSPGAGVIAGLIGLAGGRRRR